MSFYWQNAVPQESGQSSASTWDNINLGGAPSQQQQPAQQSFSYENQQNATGGYDAYVNPYADQWAAYHAQQAALQQQQQTAAQQAVYQPQIEHQPILTQQPAVESAVPAPPSTDHSVHESQSNHTTYDGWGHEAWSSHEPSVEPQVQPSVQAHQYQQYYQEQIPQQPAVIQHPQQLQQEWAPEVTSSTTSTVVEQTPPPPPPSAPIQLETAVAAPPVVEKQPSPAPNHHHVEIPAAAAAPLDFGFDEEEREEEVKELQPTEELVEQTAVGWGEDWKEEEEVEGVSSQLAPPTDDQPRTSTPSPVEEEMEKDPSPTFSPIVKESAPSPSPPLPSSISHPPPPPSTVTTTPFAPPPPIILAPSEFPPAEEETSGEPSKTSSLLSSSKVSPSTPSPNDLVGAGGGVHPVGTDTTQKTSPPASLDSWVEVSSSGSDAINHPHQQQIPPPHLASSSHSTVTIGRSSSPALSLRGKERGGAGVGKDGVPPLAASSPQRGEKKRLSVSSMGGAENGMDRRRDDSDSTHDGKRNLREDFTKVRNKYGDLFNRFNQYRTSGREGNKTPTRVNPLLAAANHGGVRVGIALTTAKNSTPKEYNQDTSYPPPFDSNLSAIDSSKMYANHSANMSMESRGYGEDIVDAYRKERHRPTRSSRPESRAKSEYGDALLHRSQASDRAHHNRSVHDYSHMMHPQYGYYPTGRYSLGRTHSSMGLPYSADPYENRRPHSTYDHAAHLRMAQSGRGAEYDAYEYVSSEESEEGDEEEDHLPNESDNEMRRINSSAAAAAAASRSSTGRGMGGGGRAGDRHLQQPPIRRGLGVEEAHYFGFVKLEMNTVEKLMHNFPPPPQFWTFLEPIERVAYLYYTALHHKNFPNVPDFQNRFKKAFYTFKCDRYTETESLIKVCQLMQEAATKAKRSQKEKAYEASQRQLFSDDRETPESRLSDRPSVYDHNQLSDADESIDVMPKEPYKFRLPHAFATFGPGGKIIQVIPGHSVATVHMMDMHTVVRDREMQRAVSQANQFKGPLIPTQTPPHVVRAYIRTQMERIRRSDLAQADPRNDDIIDCLLVWQLLEKVVQQHGKVTGPDMAELLMQTCPRREKNGGGGTGGGIGLEIAPPTPDPRAYESFTFLLLQGLIDNAINLAMDNGLFMDAITLARRLAPSRVEEIEQKHLATRPRSHPVLTLLSVAANEPAPCLSSMAADDRGGWRWHAALLFANLAHSPYAMENIRKLGEELVRRDCNAAADFCFLSVALLAGMDTFTPPGIDPLTGAAPSVRRHIDLIHASIPDDAAEAMMCEYGFSLVDLHATEIFDYGSRLSGGATNLAISAGYQRRRIQYAKLLAGYGGFSLDSFRYCTEVARTMWEKMSLFSSSEVTELVDLADRLHRMAAADEGSTIWIESLRQMIPSHQMAPQPVAPVYQQAPVAAAVAPVSEEPAAAATVSAASYHSQQQLQQQRERSESISTEAAAWHSRGGDAPLEMRGEQQQQAETAYQQQQQAAHHEHHQEQQQYSSVSSSSAHHYDGYSSGTTTEGGMGSEESTPRRERSASINNDDFYLHQQHHQQQPNPLAPVPVSTPAPAPVPAVAAMPVPTPAPAPVLRAPAPMPAMPALPIAPPSAAPLPAMQPSPQQLIKQDTASSSQSQKAAAAAALPKKGASSSGLKGWMMKKLSAAVGEKEVYLPDDTKKTIYYDEKLGRYVGEGVEEEEAPPPPPSIPGSMNGLSGMDGGGGGGPPPMMAGGGLKAARNSGGSRYFNPLNDASKSSAAPAGMPPMGMPAPPTFPTQFSFIPTMPDDAVTDSPFSEQPVLSEGGEQAVGGDHKIQ